MPWHLAADLGRPPAKASVSERGLRYVVGVGANLGAPKEQVLSAYEALDDAVRLLACSCVYRSPALVEPGVMPGPDYANGAVLLEWSSSANELLETLHRIEAQFGRIRRRRWEDRPLDLDILWSDRALRGTTLCIPHRELEKRAFALAPLLDVVPELADRYGSTLERLPKPELWR